MQRHAYTDYEWAHHHAQQLQISFARHVSPDFLLCSWWFGTPIVLSSYVYNVLCLYFRVLITM
jgi:hypothetical protein